MSDDYEERVGLAIRLGWVCKGKRTIEIWLPPAVPDEEIQYMELPSLQHLEATKYDHVDSIMERQQFEG